MGAQDHIPDHWEAADWEQKAKENPLHAIMTIEGYRDKTLDDLSDGAPEEFLEKGRTIYREMVEQFLTDEEKSRRLAMFDYGCGAGRIMNAVLENDHDAYGADISPTMIEACGVVAPRAKARLVVAENGDVALPDASCDVAYSFAVVQHIRSLALHNKAISEMCRIVKPGGLLSIQVNCEDYDVGDGFDRGYTVNHEDFSIHFDLPEDGPSRVHEQNNWSGVYIGSDTLTALLVSHGFRVVKVFNWNPKKRRAMVFVARKEDGDSVISARSNPFERVTAGMYAVLLKKYARVAMDRSRMKRELTKLKAK